MLLLLGEGRGEHHHLQLTDAVMAPRPPRARRKAILRLKRMPVQGQAFVVGCLVQGSHRASWVYPVKIYAVTTSHFCTPGTSFLQLKKASKQVVVCTLVVIHSSSSTCSGCFMVGQGGLEETEGLKMKKSTKASYFFQSVVQIMLTCTITVDNRKSLFIFSQVTFILHKMDNMYLFLHYFRAKIVVEKGRGSQYTSTYSRAESQDWIIDHCLHEKKLRGTNEGMVLSLALFYIGLGVAGFLWVGCLHEGQQTQGSSS